MAMEVTRLFLTMDSDYVVTPGMGSYGAGGSVNNYIQSGQAFFVQGDSVVGGSLTFKEDAKTSGSGQVSVVGRISSATIANQFVWSKCR